MTTAPSIKPRLGRGIYTLPDAALILSLPLKRLRYWVGGYLDEAVSPPPGMLSTWGKGRGRGFDFHVLIEAYTVYTLRQLGVPMSRVRKAREILSAHLDSPFPFAAKGILAQGGRVLFDPENSAGALLDLEPGVQSEFKEIIRPFCKELDFSRETGLAERFWPMGRESQIVVDPRISFGRPVIVRTGITAEAVASLIEAGESAMDVAAQFDVSVPAVEEAHRFIHRKAA